MPNNVITMETITDASTWDQTLLALPYPHILQSWAWGELKVQHGWKRHCALWRAADGTPAAAALILQQRRGKRGFGYIPKGPCLDWANLPLVEQVLSDIEALAHTETMLLIKLDPDVRTDTPKGQAVVELLRERNWRPSFEQVQFRNTALLDLRQDLDAIMAEMKPKWRYNIRLAVRKGVAVREATVTELPTLYALYEETARRDNFIIRQEPYYLEAWQTMMAAGNAVPLLAEVAGAPVAMLVLFHFGPQAWYMYGASRDLHRDWMPNHLLQWEAIRRAKTLGCTRYDLWGAPDVLDDSDPMWGVYRFKLGFGAEFAPHIGAYDYTPAGWLYHVYAFLRPRLVNLAQRRYWSQNKPGAREQR